MNDSYVYLHFKKGTDQVFYVGKGCKNRAFDVKGRNQYWEKIVKKYGYDIKIVFKDLTESEAFAKEIELINYYRSIGQANTNIRDGGESGKLAEETKDKIRNALLGVKTRPCPEYLKKLIGDKQRGKKRRPLTDLEKYNRRLNQSGKPRKGSKYKVLTHPNRANKKSFSYKDPSGFVFINSEEAAKSHNLAGSTVRKYSRLRLHGWSQVPRKNTWI